MRLAFKGVVVRTCILAAVLILPFYVFRMGFDRGFETVTDVDFQDYTTPFNQTEENITIPSLQSGSWQLRSPYLDRWLTISDLRGNDRFQFNVPDACENEVYLVNVIKSKVGNFDKRKVVREMWGSVTMVEGKRIQTVFLMAMSGDESQQREVEFESGQYQDIIQIRNFLDSYQSNTYKTLILFQWVLEYCQGARYVAYMDDDVLFVPERIVKYLSRAPEPLFGGHRYGTAKVARKDPKNKWFVSWSDYYRQHYPPYIAGSGTIFSRSAVARLYTACRSVPFLFHIDDAYLGICADFAKIKPIQIPGFLYPYMSHKKKPMSHRVYVNFKAVHGLGEEKQRDWWKTLYKTSQRKQLL